MGEEHSARFRLAPEIISETFDDGESIVVNLENGFYFSLNQVGGEMFALLSKGTPVGEVGRLLAERYEEDAATTTAETASFAVRLLEEGLVVASVSEAPGTNGAGHAPPLSPLSSPPPAAYEPPTLTSYTDMQDLLLADPIHDFNETGWPARVDDR
jgi:hypothetical protein